jgi:hypothetical protein
MDHDWGTAVIWVMAFMNVLLFLIAFGVWRIAGAIESIMPIAVRIVADGGDRPIRVIVDPDGEHRPIRVHMDNR